MLLNPNIPLVAGGRDGKKLRLDATLDEVYDVGSLLGEGGGCWVSGAVRGCWCGAVVPAAVRSFEVASCFDPPEVACPCTGHGERMLDQRKAGRHMCWVADVTAERCHPASKELRGGVAALPSAAAAAAAHRSPHAGSSSAASAVGDAQSSAVPAGGQAGRWRAAAARPCPHWAHRCAACASPRLHPCSTGFSKVKLATHRETGKQYACKVVPLPRPGKRLNEHLSDRGAIMKVRCRRCAALRAPRPVCHWWVAAQQHPRAMFVAGTRVVAAWKQDTSHVPWGGVQWLQTATALP